MHKLQLYCNLELSTIYQAKYHFQTNPQYVLFLQTQYTNLQKENKEWFLFFYSAHCKDLSEVSHYFYYVDILIVFYEFRDLDQPFSKLNRRRSNQNRIRNDQKCELPSGKFTKNQLKSEDINKHAMCNYEIHNH